jgi:hypothetical protein
MERSVWVGGVDRTKITKQMGAAPGMVCVDQVGAALSAFRLGGSATLSMPGTEIQPSPCRV